MSKDLYNYKRTATRTARELFYKDSVIEAIAKATSISEISRIMSEARRGH